MLSSDLITSWYFSHPSKKKKKAKFSFLNSQENSHASHNNNLLEIEVENRPAFP